MKKPAMLYALSFLFLISLASCKKKSSEEFVKNFGKTVCYKMADCAQETLKDIPEAQRAMIMDRMPSKEKCDQDNEKKYSKDNPVIEITSSEQSIGEKCLDDISKADCQSIQKGLPSCRQFSEILQRKQKS